MVIQAASFYSPVLAIALSGVESGSDRFRNQTAVLSDVLNPGGWVRSGRVLLVELPKALAYVTQGLLGAMSVQSRQFDLAVVLARSALVIGSRDRVSPLYAQTDINGWVQSLGGRFTDCTKFLLALPERWEWLDSLFENEHDFGSCVSCYYMILLAAELTALCKEGTALGQDTCHFHVPPVFWFTSSDLARKALQRLLNEADQVRSIWRDLGVPGERVADAWDAYHASWAKSEAAFNFNIELAMEVLGNPVRHLL
jgi:hypothetical protein